MAGSAAITDSNHIKSPKIRSYQIRRQISGISQPQQFTNMYIATLICINSKSHQLKLQLKIVPTNNCNSKLHQLKIAIQNCSNYKIAAPTIKLQLKIAPAIKLQLKIATTKNRNSKLYQLKNYCTNYKIATQNCTSYKIAIAILKIAPTKNCSSKLHQL